jgi:hypothetical protein
LIMLIAHMRVLSRNDEILILLITNLGALCLI